MNSPGKDIIEGLEDAIAFSKGDQSRARISPVRIPGSINVRAVRKHLGMTQEEFSRQFGFPIGTLRNWEQGHRKPQGASRVLLTLIKEIPEEVKMALAS